MPNDYLIACHRYITHELDRLHDLRQKAESHGKSHEVAFHEGQIEELTALRQYMSEHFDLTTQRYY